MKAIFFIATIFMLLTGCSLKNEYKLPNYVSVNTTYSNQMNLDLEEWYKLDNAGVLSLFSQLQISLLEPENGIDIKKISPHYQFVGINREKQYIDIYVEYQRSENKYDVIVFRYFPAEGKGGVSLIETESFTEAFVGKMISYEVIDNYKELPFYKVADAIKNEKVLELLNGKGISDEFTQKK